MAVSPGSRRIGGVHFDIDGNAAGFKREVKGAEAQARRSNNVIQGEFRKTEAAAAGAEKRIRGMGASLIALGAAAGLGLTASVGILKDFAQAMSTVEAVTGASAAQMAALTAEARRLGASTRFSATQAAEGMVYLARAGFTANEALQAVEGTLKLAQAGGLELGRAADIASNVLSGFNLKTTETSRVVDVLAKAANSANTDVSQLGEALKFAAPTAVALGLDLEQTVAAIGKLSDAGIQGGLAGRGFQSTATKAIQEADKIEAIIGKFSLAEDGLTGLVKRLVEAGITTQEVVDIFRAENLDVFTILANAAFDAEKGLDALEKKLREARGTADRVAATMDDNINGAILTTVSSLQELVLALGDAGATDALITAFSGLTSLFRAAAENADLVGIAITALSLRALLPLAVSYIPRALAMLKALSLSLIGIQTQAAASSRAVALFGGPLTLALAAAAAAYVALGRAAEETRDRINGAKAELEATKALIDATNDIIANQNPFDELGESASFAERAINAVGDAVDGLSDKIKELTNDTRRKALLDIGLQAGNNEQKIRELEEARNKAASRAFNAPNLRGRAGLQANVDRALENFDNSEPGRLLQQLRQENARLGLQAKGLVEGLFLPDGYDDEVQAREAVAKLEKQIADLKEKGIRTEGTLIEQQLANAKAVLSYLEKGVDLATAQTLARSDAATRRGAGSTSKKTTGTTTDPNDNLLDESAYDPPPNDALARKRYDNFVATREENRRAQEAKAQAEQELKDSFALSISDGLYQAITSGDWGEAVRQTFADAASRGLLNAIDSFASALVQALSEIDLGGGGAGGGGFFSSVASFFGGRAGGGDVMANRRYLVGENGPEMFVPNVSGFIAPNSTPQPINTPGGLSGGGAGNVTAQFIVQGSITEEVMPRVRQMFGDFSKNLPGAIDARLADRRKRGAI